MKRFLRQRDHDNESSSPHHQNAQRRMVVFVLLLTGGFVGLQLGVDGPPDYASMEIDENKTHPAATRKRTNITADLLSIGTRPEISDLIHVLPEPQDPDTVEIYNMTTHHELVQSLFSKKNFTICVNGGSSSAGAGGVRLEDRYFSKYYHYQKTIQTPTTPDLQLVDRSHGNRDSLHSAIFAESFFPPEVDLLLWEFAINNRDHHNSNDDRGQLEQSALLAWLQQVERMRPEPPKVILIYLWPAFRLDDSKLVTNPVFAAHDRIAKEYDFAVGHVNLMSYMHELQFPNWEDTQLLYPRDWMHVNQMGHLVVAFLLLNLVHGPSRLEVDTTATTTTSSTQALPPRTAYSWQCGNETAAKRFL
jgi:hypothetical protein